MPQPSISIHPLLAVAAGRRAALAAAEDAGDLHLGAGLGEGEERRTETRLHARAEQRFHGVVERALQIAERDVGIDRQTLDLVEHRRVRGVGRIVAVHLAGNDDAHRRLQLSMVRICTGEVCVRSSKRSRCGFDSWSGDEQRVLRIARGMVRRKIQRLEIVVVGLDLGAFLDR